MMGTMSPPDLNAGKRAALEQLLDQGMVLVTLDARVEGVRVPLAHAGDPQLRLNLSYRFGLPMESTDEGVTATLTFGGVPFECHMPWQAIYMLVSHVTGQPFLFPADIPDDIRHAMAAEAERAQLEEGATAPPRGPRLEVITSSDGDGPEDVGDTGDGGDTEPDTAAGPPDGPAPTGPRKGGRRGHLRVVK